MADAERDDELTEDELHAKLTEAAEKYTVSFKSNALSILADFHAERARFQYICDAYWSEAFDHFDLCYRLAYGIGHGINERNKAAASARKDRVFEVLARLHTWALLTASEVRAMVFTGHGGGALGHSRTALEQAVIATFIQQHGHDVAERFLRHGPADERRRIQAYNKAATELGEEPYDPAEVARIEQECAELEKEYGKNYLERYGWAAECLFPGNPKATPTYQHIEEKTDIRRIRHYYLLASQRVHAGASGSRAHLYPSPTGGGYVTGPSDIHLALPAVATLFALQQTAAIFAMHALQDYEDRQPTVEFMALRRLTNEAAEVFNGMEDALAALREAASPAGGAGQSESEEAEGKKNAAGKGDGAQESEAGE